MAPWAISREQGCAETTAAAIERIVALGPPRCCDERAPPLDEMAERGLELAARPMAKIGAAVEYRLGEVPPSARIAIALANHEIAHGRPGLALDHLAGGIARELENPPLSEQERPRQWTRIAEMHEGRAHWLLRLGRREEAAEAARQGRDCRQRAGR